jgi:hypothetical protein
MNLLLSALNIIYIKSPFKLNGLSFLLYKLFTKVPNQLFKIPVLFLYFSIN